MEPVETLRTDINERLEEIAKQLHVDGRTLSQRSSTWAPTRSKLNAYLPGGSKYTGARDASLKDEQAKEEDN